MTENQNDGQTQVQGQAAQPSATPSEPGSKPFEGDVTKLFSSLQDVIDKRFSDVEKNLSEKLGRVQGTVDRSSNDFKQWLGKVEKLESKGMSREDAIAELERGESETEWRRNLENQVKNIASILQSGGAQSSMGQKAAEVFSKVGLDPKDPRVAQFLVKEYQSPEAMELTAYRLRDELASAPNPTSSQSASMTGKVSANNEAELITALQELQKSPVKNAKEIAEIEVKLGWR